MTTTQPSSVPLAPPGFNLDEPGTIAFTAERAFVGRKLTAFCLSLRNPEIRIEYLVDPERVMRRHGLDGDERTLVRARDWTGLMCRGAHLHAVLKLVATQGGTLFDIGAHALEMSVDDLIEACPRRVSAVPEVC